MTTDPRVEQRMDAYYYSFVPTGIDEIDKILSAVACAGKAYHHTESWLDDCDPYGEHRGDAPRDWIQFAAEDAATAWRQRAPAADAAALAGAGELANRCKDVGMKTTGRSGDLLLFAAATLTAQAARLQELEAALRPFANKIREWGMPVVSTGDFERARDALGKPA